MWEKLERNIQLECGSEESGFMKDIGRNWETSWKELWKNTERNL